MLDQIQEELFRWDIKLTQELTQNIQLMVDLNNVTNWPDARFMRHHGFTSLKEYYGWQGSLGIRASL